MADDGRDRRPRLGLLPLLVIAVDVVGLIATVYSLTFCYVSIANLSPRAALAAGFGMWLLASACQLTMRAAGLLTGGGLRLLWGIPSVAVWAELLRRGPSVFFGDR
ncbi:MAG: hypothetical protein ACRC33_12225 [Gemmataceae bacterium]